MKAAETLVKLLAERKMSVTTAESCTGGLVSALITAVPGASQVLEGAVVAYSPRIKESFLSVPAEVIEHCGIVSSETAAAMAKGAAERFTSDCAIALTGYAGPDGGDQDNPIGTVWIGIVCRTQTLTHKVHIEGDRDAVRLGAAQKALELLCSLLGQTDSN